MKQAKTYDDVVEQIFDGIETWVVYDPGCYRTPNGDGWPPSTSVEIVPDLVYVVFGDESLADEFAVADKIHDTREIDHYNGPGKCDEPPTIELTATLKELLRLPNEKLVAKFHITEATA